MTLVVGETPKEWKKPSKKLSELFEIRTTIEKGDELLFKYSLNFISFFN